MRTKRAARRWGVLTVSAVTLGLGVVGCGGAATRGDAAAERGSGGAMGSGGQPAFDGGVDRDAGESPDVPVATGGHAGGGGETSSGIGGAGGTGFGGAGASGGSAPGGSGAGGGPTGGRSGTGGRGTGGTAPDGGSGDVPASGGAGAVGTGGGGGAGNSSRAVDLLFLIDDSSSMAPLQQKLMQRLPDFMNVLKGIPGGLPDLHVAVVTSSLGAGRFANVPGCAPTTLGNTNGAFQHATACTALHPGQTFISAADGVNNFDGDIADVFSCIANVGQKGCGFEHQFEATRVALQRAQDPNDPENAGFLRPEALLAVVMVTNEDDCSAPVDSDLFDPSQLTLADPYGGLQSYRCNEFGHICDGGRPPHQAAGTLNLTGCTSAEEQGRLLTVHGFVEFLRALKPQPNKILAAALAGPTDTYRIEPKQFMLATGGTEDQPMVAHSCTQTPAEYADPAVRVKNWTDAFGENGIFESICAADFAPPLNRIANAIARLITP